MKHDLKVFIDMDERLPEALQETPSGGRLDLSLYFRRKPDGSRWGSVIIKGAAGQPLAELPMDSPEGMNMTLARLVYVGFRTATRARSRSRH